MDKQLAEWYEKHVSYGCGGYDYRTDHLAQYLGVSTRTIQRWIKGQRKPKEEMLQKIGKYLEEKAVK